jgi:hypothetical protein
MKPMCISGNLIKNIPIQSIIKVYRRVFLPIVSAVTAARRFHKMGLTEIAVQHKYARCRETAYRDMGCIMSPGSEELAAFAVLPEMAALR